MHSKDARVAGETEQRLYTLPAWRETPFFTARERAALAWTEAITRISECAIDDELYAGLRQHFSEKEAVDLTLAVVAINGWPKSKAARSRSMSVGCARNSATRSSIPFGASAIASEVRDEAPPKPAMASFAVARPGHGRTLGGRGRGDGSWIAP